MDFQSVMTHAWERKFVCSSVDLQVATFAMRFEFNDTPAMGAGSFLSRGAVVDFPGVAKKIFPGGGQKW